MSDRIVTWRAHAAAPRKDRIPGRDGGDAPRRLTSSTLMPGLNRLDPRPKVRTPTAA